jgi:Lar family restriction alleviation protein
MSDRTHCPHCGSDRNEIRAPRMSLRFVECIKCGARGPKSYDGSDDAVALWNKRATLAPVIPIKPPLSERLISSGPNAGRVRRDVRPVPGFEGAYFGCEDDSAPD